MVAESQRGYPDHPAKYITESGLDLVLLYSTIPRLNVLSAMAFSVSQRSKHPVLQQLPTSLCVFFCPSISSTVSQHKLSKKHHVISHLTRELQTASNTSRSLLSSSFSLDYGWSLGQNWVKHHRIYQISLYNLKAAIWRGKIEAWSQKDQIYIANIRRWPTAGKLAALLFWPPWRELPITAFCVQYFPPLVAL